MPNQRAARLGVNDAEPTAKLSSNFFQSTLMSPNVWYMD